jgi:hypothetical protein
MANVDVALAVKTAMLFLRNVMQDQRSANALLEEVEQSEDGSEWLVTISVPTPQASASLASVISPTLIEPRDYRLIRVNAANASVSSMRIRKL